MNGTCRIVTGTDLHGKVVIQAENARSSTSGARGKYTVSVCRRSANGSNFADSRSNLYSTGCDGMKG